MAAVSREPFFELDRRIRILQPRQLLRPSERGGTVPTVARHCVVNQSGVEQDSGVVDALVQDVSGPFSFGHRETGEPVVDGEFDLDVAAVVGDELLPSIRVGCGRIAHPTLVEDAGLGRGAELADEFLARAVFAYRQVTDGGDLL